MSASSASRTPFTTETRELGEAVLIEMHGELDLASAEEARSALGAAAEQEPEAVIADLCDVHLLDSTGLMVLLDAAHDDRAPRFVVVCPGGLSARGVLSITGVGEMLEILDSREELQRRFGA
jgi:anti-anti-sigma factor